MAEYEEQLQQMSKREIAEFEAWLSVYEKQYPPPKIEVSGLGWQFWAAIVVAVAGIALAAFRTAQQFFSAAVYKGDPIFAIGEAIAAVLAVEGTLVLFSTMRAYKQRKVSDFSASVGRWVAFGISALAGIAQSLNLFSGNAIIVQFMGIFQVILVLSLGLGATVIALFGGDILGVQLVEYENRKEQANEQYVNSVRSYRSRMLSKWRKERTEPNEQRTPERTERTTEPIVRSGKRREQIQNTLARVANAENRVAGVTELADMFGVAKSYVSVVRKEWMEANGIE